MRFELTAFNRNVSDEELLADLQRVASTLSKATISTREQNRLGHFHSNTITQRFQSWGIALQKAGLQQSQQRNVPTEELFKNIEELWVRLGRQPRFRDVRGSNSFGTSMYLTRFGSWRNALEQFVASINVVEQTESKSNVALQPSKAALQPRGTRTVNWRLRFLVMRRDCFRCRSCGRAPATNPSISLAVDHILAWSKGGPTVIENLQTLCTECNVGKSDLDFVESSSCLIGR